MRVRKPFLNVLTASVFVVGTAFAAGEPTPTPESSGLTRCQVTNAQICCTGHLANLAPGAVIFHVEGAFLCHTSEKPVAEIVSGDTSVTIPAGSPLNALTFENVCTVVPKTECAASWDGPSVSVWPTVDLVVEQPKGTKILREQGSVLPFADVAKPPK